MRRMTSTLTLCLLPGVFAATLAVPTAAQAGNVSVACSVAVDYLRNGNLGEQYRKDFIVEEGVQYVDDFSTPARFKRFTANVARTSGETTVSVDYFSDVGVFHAVGFATQLTIRGGNVEVAIGRQDFSASNSTVPGSVGGNHTTNYSLSCRRN